MQSTAQSAYKHFKKSHNQTKVIARHGEWHILAGVNRSDPSVCNLALAQQVGGRKWAIHYCFTVSTPMEEVRALVSDFKQRAAEQGMDHIDQMREKFIPLIHQYFPALSNDVLSLTA